ncbi:hypothetical protein F5Y03DRAFT_403153 [Xylaria venustula]|nr:hypothetical protein F5Y03DRAFT_403153 [Xylaria venustula]
MASINLTAANGVDNIIKFGKYYQTIVTMKPNVVNNRKLLHPNEASFIRGTAAYDNSTAIVSCQKKLDLRLNYYYNVKHQITSFLRVCSYLIPKRVSIGFLGPYVGIPQLDTGFDNIPVLSRLASYHSETSTAVNSSVHWAEYERSIQDGDHRPLSDEKEYLKVLALSPTVSNDSFENVNIQNSGAEIISISSDNDGGDSEYSDESEKLQFPFEPDGKNVPNSSFRKPDPYRSKNLNDALWEKLLSGLPEAQRPHREEAQCDKNIGKRPPVSNELKLLSLKLENITSKKRKFIAAHSSDNHKYKKETRRGSKRPRTL